ncbi:hypothetical protein MUN89_07415 [Halobacillus salinarum]|uniref:Uncharacterized protein n=1 Tax=Halobacillus salinarum TaxID=2932257 RepID=A0ABY4ENM3_9BACI|nr:hypothetical protein [Halobacillus salinarum]UOQ45748.1 hypothetical protein MUN89_07415 [Halobacillus salinarum]
MRVVRVWQGLFPYALLYPDERTQLNNFLRKLFFYCLISISTRGVLLTKSTEYYVNRLSSCVMNHLFSSGSCSLRETYDQWKQEITELENRDHELKNLETAYALVFEELAGKPPAI